MAPEERARLLAEERPDSWIALSSDESKIVGRGSTYLEAVQEADQAGEGDPLLIKTPNEWSNLVL
jgi:hypothetical protein